MLLALPVDLLVHAICPFLQFEQGDGERLLRVCKRVSMTQLGTRMRARMKHKWVTLWRRSKGDTMPGTPRWLRAPEPLPPVPHGCETKMVYGYNSSGTSWGWQWDFRVRATDGPLQFNFTEPEYQQSEDNGVIKICGVPNFMHLDLRSAVDHVWEPRHRRLLFKVFREMKLQKQMS
jgi:hypothetical protein